MYYKNLWSLDVCRSAFLHFFPLENLFETSSGKRKKLIEFRFLSIICLFRLQNLELNYLHKTFYITKLLRKLLIGIIKRSEIRWRWEGLRIPSQQILHVFMESSTASRKTFSKKFWVFMIPLKGKKKKQRRSYDKK